MKEYLQLKNIECLDAEGKLFDQYETLLLKNIECLGAEGNLFDKYETLFKKMTKEEIQQLRELWEPTVKAIVSLYGSKKPLMPSE